MTEADGAKYKVELVHGPPNKMVTVGYEDIPGHALRLRLRDLANALVDNAHERGTAFVSISISQK